jgi:ABC-type sulfate transport system substrate-binding protein
VRAGHVLRGGGAGAESTIASRAMSVVVLEQEKEVGAVRKKDEQKK